MCENPGYIYTNTGAKLELDLSQTSARVDYQDLPAVPAEDPLPTSAILFDLERGIED